MKIRGERECQDCGGRWSYYETGSIACPRCGSIHSRGLDEERKRHTTSPIDFDLTEVRAEIERQSLRTVATAAKDACRAYTRKVGFIHGGDLRPLDDTYLGASELLHVADVFERSSAPTDEEELHFLTLLRGADAGERLPPEDVPASLRNARGLAYANAVREYRRELVDWRQDTDPTIGSALELLGDHVRRIRALEGDVSPRTSETLVMATRDLATALVDDDEESLSMARDRLSRIE